MLSVGTKAPDFTLNDLFGQPVSLEKYRGRQVILVFLRHLGWLFCRAHLAQLRRQYDRIQRLGGEVIIISFEDRDGLKRLVESHKLPFTVLLDSEKKVYRAYSMVYKEKGALISWRTVVAYLRLRFSGYPRLKKGSDVKQMGGDVLVDKDGVIQFIYRSEYPEDQPDISPIMTLLKNDSR